MHTKDFNSLLNLLDISQQSGILLVEVPGENWQAKVQLEDGKPLSCIIVGITDGRILFNGMQAIQWLSGRGELQWRIEEGQSSTRDSPFTRPSQAFPSSQQAGKAKPEPSSRMLQGRDPHLYPRRLNRYLIVDNSWPREMRRVFALIDGTRTLEEIAQLLNKSPEEIRAILQELASQGFIQL